MVEYSVPEKNPINEYPWYGVPRDQKACGTCVCRGDIERWKAWHCDMKYKYLKAALFVRIILLDCEN